MVVIYAAFLGLLLASYVPPLQDIIAQPGRDPRPRTETAEGRDAKHREGAAHRRS